MMPNLEQVAMLHFYHNIIHQIEDICLYTVFVSAWRDYIIIHQEARRNLKVFAGFECACQ